MKTYACLATLPAQETTKRLVLIGCVKTKREPGCWLEYEDGHLGWLPTHTPAEELYSSPLFAARKAYAEAAGHEWAILSAQYGIVRPRQLIQSYDTRINHRPDYWGIAVKWELRRIEDLAVIEVHAGKPYVDALIEALQPRHYEKICSLKQDLNIEVEHPVAGLQIGEQLAWYKAQALGGQG